MMRFYMFIITILCLGFRAEAQDKILASGSGNRNILLIDKQTGKVEWQHPLEEGEECNTVALTPEGNVLYSYKRGAKVVTGAHRVVWNYQTPDKTELQSATLLNNGGILLGICGTPARFIELNAQGKEMNSISLDLNVEKPHSQFRQVFRLRNGNYLIPVMAKKKTIEVTSLGKVVAEHDTAGRAFSSLELSDGNLLLPCGDEHYYIIVDRRTGRELKRVTGDDLKGISLLFVAQVVQLKNRNLLICNWGGHTKDTTVDEPQLIEVNSKGEVVWTLNDKKNIGKISAIHYLENMKLPEFKQEESL